MIDLVRPMASAYLWIGCVWNCEERVGGREVSWEAAQVGLDVAREKTSAVDSSDKREGQKWEMKALEEPSTPAHTFRNQAQNGRGVAASEGLCQ